MDTGQGDSSGDAMDRRSLKRRKPCSASSIDSDQATKPSKLTKEDQSINFPNRKLTCDDLGYSNLPGGNSYQSNFQSDQRQVSASISNTDENHSSVNAFDHPNVCRENEVMSENEHELYSHVDYNVDYDKAKSLECEIMEAIDPKSCSGEYVNEVNQAPTNTCATPQPKPPSLTDLVRSMFSPATAETFSQSILHPPKTPDVSEGSAESISRENNVFLRDLVKNNKVSMSVLGGIYTSVNKCSADISLMSTRLGKLELYVGENIKKINARFDQNEHKISDLSHKINQTKSELYSHVDDRIQNITSEFPEMLSKMERDVDAKIGYSIGKVENEFHSRLSKLPTTNEVKNLCELSVQQCITEGKLASRADLNEINKKLGALKLDNYPNYDEKINQLEKDIASLKEMNKGLEASLKTNPATGIISDRDKHAWEKFKSKTEAALDDLPILKGNMAESLKTVRSLDVKSRRINLIIDQLLETDNEDTLSTVNNILDHALSPQDRHQVEILKAFRLGVKLPRGPPRKIFMELSTPKGRDIILDNSQAISRVGNEGKLFYVNEDLPESIKRRKNDLHKYVLYLRRLGHQASKVGDDIIIDGNRHKYEELNSLPVGQRYMDSRTIFNDGIVAFQSTVSPLSNLFPCKLRYEGYTYTSLEQCYQYHRAVHHNRPQLARLILNTNDPYEAMYHGKSVRWEDRDWENKKLGTMERMIRHKADQSLVFVTY